MYQNVHVKLLNLLLSLSDALDLASPELSNHQIRTAFIAWEIGKLAGLSREDETDLFIAGLLHDVGALTPEEKLEVRMHESKNPRRHCILGEKLLAGVPTFETAAKIVRLHHIDCADHLAPENDAIARSAQILMLADSIERHIDRGRFILHQEKDLTADVCARLERYIAPDLLGMFRSVARREDFWLDLTSPRLYSILINNGPGRAIEIDFSHLLAISEMFRDMIDFRSRFTATHSSGVAATAATLSRLFGFTESEVELMEVAGNFHDLGKMAIPNSVLAKPGKLTGEEFAIMRQHTYYTYSILNTIGGIRPIAEWAAFHHERLDGSGYPFHVSAKDLNIKSRIMAVADIFTALSETRPYRDPMPPGELFSTLKNLVAKNWLDASIVALLEQNYAEIAGTTRQKQAVTQQFYEREFSG